MILCVGEILVDRIIKPDGVADHVGGAPFNVAVNVLRYGGEVTFVGRVGDDADGKFVLGEAEKHLPERCKIEVDGNRKTTVAAVTLVDGERYFRFERENGADYAFDKAPRFSDFSGLKIVHLGTLMLNYEQGVRFAKQIVERCERENVLFSVDANFRDDLFASKEERNRAMLPFLKAADIVKLSDDELIELTGKGDVEEGIAAFAPKDLMFVTCGKRGSVAYKKGVGFVRCETEPAERVVDTTGAGDAYYGAVLAGLDRLLAEGKPLDREALIKIMTVGNDAGKKATQREGAV